MAQCKEMFCIAEAHEDNLHVDVTGTTWRTTDEDGGYEIVHTTFDPWVD